MKLCLLVSRRCDLRCDFCSVEFTGRDMEWGTARLAVERYLRWSGKDAPRVKFFGGEPLLNFDLIRRLVDLARTEWAGAGLSFELATNGSFLDEAKLLYFRGRPEVEVTVSQPVPGASALPGAWFTMVLDRDCGPESTLARMRELLRKGYRRFNFLPAYYAVWSPEQTRNLRRSFAVLERLLAGLWAAGEPVAVKNLGVWSPVPLYNDALTVDVDGAIYASNMVQCRGMEKYRDRLRVATLADAPESAAGLRVDGDALEDILREWTGPERWASTRRVDAALTDFVVALRPASPAS